MKTWWASLGEATRRDFTRRWSDSLVAAGLTVYRADTDSFAPIPACLTPAVHDDANIAALRDDATQVLALVARIAVQAWVDPAHEALWRGFTDLERRAITPERLLHVTTARIDCFAQGSSEKVLELNATIPAMQGYSDIVTHGWIRAVGVAKGFPDATIEQLIAQNGSNTADLLASIDAAAKTPGSLLIVSRRGDSQLGELRHYVREFAKDGRRVAHAWVDEVAVDAAGQITAHGQSWDAVYRHIFARRVDPASPFAALLADPHERRVQNPVTSPLEVKGVLGLLSAAAEGENAGEWRLNEFEADLVKRRIPWTRVVSGGSTVLPDGIRADLLGYLRDNQAECVLKRSWDYGGKSVLLGPHTEPNEWADTLADAVQKPGEWVAQQLIPPRASDYLVVERSETGVLRVDERPLYADRNAYANLLGTPLSGPGVVRASVSRVVNILGGGGIAPVLRRPVFEALFPPNNNRV